MNDQMNSQTETKKCLCDPCTCGPNCACKGVCACNPPARR
jgi:hypothetical protein